MRRVRFFNLMLILFMITALAPSSTPNAQTGEQSESIPPQVIDVFPPPGVEMLDREVLTISFDQPMDVTSVRLTIEPSLNTITNWVDRQTLTVTPRRGWGSEITYVATITGAALDGTPFGEPYTFEINTLGALEVLSVTPLDADVSLDSQIVVAFNRPVVPLGASDAPSPIIIEPAIEGAGEWISTNMYVFDPRELPKATNYTVRITAGITSSDGAVLHEDYRWTFTTLFPRVESIKVMEQYTRNYVSIEAVPLDNPIFLTFSDAMDQASAERAVLLTDVDGNTVPASFSWNENTLTVQPNDLLRIDTDYTLTFADSARTLDGLPLAPVDPFTFHTQPPFAVRYHNPKNGDTDVRLQSEVSIQFNDDLRAADGDSFGAWVEVEPTPAEVRVEEKWGGLKIDFEQEPLTTYTVTIKAGIESRLGMQMADDYSFTFTTGEPDKRSGVSLEAISDIMITNVSSPDAVIGAELPSDVPINLYRVSAQEVSRVPLTNASYAKGDAYFGQSYNYYESYQRCEPPTDLNDSNRVRTWVQPTSGDEDGQDIYLASETGGQLPLGLYWLTFGEEHECKYDLLVNGWYVTHRETGFLPQIGYAVTSANITVKRGTDDVFVWVTDLDDGSPVVGATVTVYGDGEVIGSAVTAADGTASVPVDMRDYPAIVVAAEASDVFGIWYHQYWENNWRAFPDMSSDMGYRTRAPDANRGYLYTDRPIYRPGDTVYYRGVLREKHDVDYVVPERRTAYILISPYWQGETETYYGFQDNAIYTGEIALTEFGTFSGEFTLPDELPQNGYMSIRASLTPFPTVGPNPDDYYIDVSDTAFVRFSVAMYRPAEFAVNITPDQPITYLDEAFDATIRAEYYFGGGVGNREVDWNVRTFAERFQYTGSGRYGFGYAGFGDWYRLWDYTFAEPDDIDWNFRRFGQQSESGTATLDSGGTAHINSVVAERDVECFYCSNDAQTPNFPLRAVISASVEDETGQTVTGRGSITVYPSDVFVGMQIPSRTLPAGGVATISLIAVTPLSVPRAQQVIDVEIAAYFWNDDRMWGTWQQFESAQVITSADGTAEYTVNLPRAGVYFITAQSADEQGRTNRTTGYLWIIDRDVSAKWFSRGNVDDMPNYRIGPSLVADKRGYQVGETAQIIIPLPFEGVQKVLISVERAGVISHEMVEASGDALAYSLPITDEFAPNVYVAATYITPIRGERSVPEWLVSQPVRLDVQMRQRVLNVQLTASTNTASPGETVTFDVRVTDVNGNPVVAEVGLKLVDKAVLALLPSNSRSLQSQFYGLQPRTVETDLSLMGLVEQFTNFRTGIPGFGGGGGGGEPEQDIRENYQTTPLWAAHVVTDVNGTAQVSITLPDNLTTWELDARALTADAAMGVGQAKIEIMTTKPLIVRPVTPRFMVAGDQIQLGAIVNNNTGADQSVRVWIEAYGMTNNSPIEQIVFVPHGQRVRVIWNMVVQDVPSVPITIYALAENGDADAARPTLTTGENNTIPVKRFIAREMFGATGGVLREGGSLTEVISLPARLRDSDGELLVNLDPSLAAALPDSLDYLRQFPYFCIEQTVSRFLPNTVTYAALRDLGISNPDIENGLDEAIAEALTAMADDQNSDGGWGWFGGMESNPLTTGYALLGIIEARQAGFDTDTWISAAAVEKAQNVVRGEVTSELGGEFWKLNRRAMLLYVLARGGEHYPFVLDALFDARDRLNVDARAFLLMAMHEYRDNDPRTDVLIADLISVASFSATGTHWSESRRDWWNWSTNTRSTALAIAAVARTDPDNPILPNAVRWLMLARQGDYWQTTQETAWAVVALTDWIVQTGDLAPSYGYSVLLNGESVSQNVVNANTNTSQLRLKVANLLASNRLTIARDDGAGSLYYTAQFNLFTPAEDAQPMNRGFSVTREYFNERRQPLQSARVGDVITVRITVTAHEDTYFATIQDSVPAGVEIIDPKLLTNDTPGYKLYSVNSFRWYYGWWWFGQRELRDDGLYLYADYLPKGTYIYSYQVRATMSGQFQTLPTYAYTFYQPEFFGRSGGQLFTIFPQQGYLPGIDLF
jgi:alpha-2-macroglobulin